MKTVGYILKNKAGRFCIIGDADDCTSHFFTSNIHKAFVFPTIEKAKKMQRFFVAAKNHSTTIEAVTCHKLVTIIGE